MVNVGKSLSFQEMCQTTLPEMSQYLPPHQHSYHIQEVLEYIEAFALDAYVPASYKVR